MNPLDRLNLARAVDDRVHLRLPYFVPLFGGSWTVATDGHVLMALPGKFAPANDRAPRAARLESILKPIERFDRRVTTVTALRAWASEGLPPEEIPPADLMVDCPACRIGKAHCSKCGEVTCNECEGKRRVPWQRSKTVYESPIVPGVCIDRAKLRRLLTGAPDGRIEVLTAGSSDTIILRALAWGGMWCAIMPYRHDGVNPCGPIFAEFAKVRS